MGAPTVSSNQEIPMNKIVKKGSRKNVVARPCTIVVY